MEYFEQAYRSVQRIFRGRSVASYSAISGGIETQVGAIYVILPIVIILVFKPVFSSRCHKSGRSVGSKNSGQLKPSWPTAPLTLITKTLMLTALLSTSRPVVFNKMRKEASLTVLLSAIFIHSPVSASSDAKLNKLLSGIYNNSPKAIAQFPAAGYPNQLAGFIDENDLVITYSEGSCSVVKSGVCQVTAYITRSKYKRHRTNEPYAFCGSMVTWETPEKSMKKWEPTNGLAQHIADGDRSFALYMIDEKNRGYCK